MFYIKSWIQFKFSWCFPFEMILKIEATVYFSVDLNLFEIYLQKFIMLLFHYENELLLTKTTCSLRLASKVSWYFLFSRTIQALKIYIIRLSYLLQMYNFNWKWILKTPGQCFGFFKFYSYLSTCCTRESSV